MKMMRRYFLTAVAVLSVSFAAAGMAAVNESARRISLGERQSVVVWGDEARIADPAEVTDIKAQFGELIDISAKIKNRIMQILHDAV